MRRWFDKKLLELINCNLLSVGECLSAMAIVPHETYLYACLKLDIQWYEIKIEILKLFLSKQISKSLGSFKLLRPL